MATLSHWYHDWVNVALAGLEHAGMQSETRGVQSFGTKSGARAAKRAPAQQFKNQIESPDPYWKPTATHR